MKNTHDRIEHGYLDRFRTCSGLLKHAAIERPLQDPPDFFASDNGRRISIEITQVFIDSRNGSMLRSHEANRRWICGKIAKLLAERNRMSPAEVHLTFAHDEVPKSLRSNLAARITGLIEDSEPSDSREMWSLDWKPFAERDEYGSLWPEELEGFSVYRFPGVTEHDVVAGDVGWEVKDSRDQLQQAIGDKATKLAKYSEYYNENWLLIVAEGYAPSSFISPDEATRNHRYNCPFDRTFFLQAFDGRFFELLTAVE